MNLQSVQMFALGHYLTVPEVQTAIAKGELVAITPQVLDCHDETNCAFSVRRWAELMGATSMQDHSADFQEMRAGAGPLLPGMITINPEDVWEFVDGKIRLRELETPAS